MEKVNIDKLKKACELMGQWVWDTTCNITPYEDDTSERIDLTDSIIRIQAQLDARIREMEPIKEGEISASIKDDMEKIKKDSDKILKAINI